MPQPSFDLRTRPWIPVRYVTGGSGPPAVGLADLFLRADQIADITLPVPPAASGLWRVLYLIAARITGLDDADLDEAPLWRRQRARVRRAARFDADAVARYFDRNAGRLDLFHPQLPWLQDARLAGECARSSGINRMILGRAAGNNQVWLSHDTDLAPRPVPAAEAAWHLLAWLYYGASGKATARTVSGVTESNMTAGPLRSRISFHPLGGTLHESLIAGIPYPGRYDGTEPDRAPWEADDTPDPLGPPPRPRGLAGILTGRFRHALLLHPSPDGTQVRDARVTWAWRKPHPAARDPYLIFDTARGETSEYARYARHGRAIWRDLDALLLKDTGAARTCQPAVFGDLAAGPEGIAGGLRVRAFGFDQDGQTVDRQWFTAATPPILGLLESADAEVPNGLKVAREAAERAGRDLTAALRRAWKTVNDPDQSASPARAITADGPWPARGAARYWPAAERAFWHMLATCDFAHPANTFIKIALRAYDDVTSQHASRGPRVARAVETARTVILTSWDRTGSAQQKEPVSG